MARIEFQGGESTGGGTWQPLPAGAYCVQYDAVEAGVSKNKHSQLKISGHVVDGPHDGAKVTIFQIIMASTSWRLEQMLSAALGEGGYDKTDTGEVQERTMKNGSVIEEPVFSFGFDTDDLIGCQVVYDVTQRTYRDEDGNDKISNDFNNPRPVASDEDAAPAKPAAAAKPAARAAAPVAAAKPAAAPAAAAQPARRRVAG